MDAEEQNGDFVLRAITDDDNFRVMAAVTTQTVRGVLAAQQAHGATAAQLGDLVTGSVLIRETMSPAHRVQGILRGANGSLVADAHPDGLTRGLLQLRSGNQLELGGTPRLEMMRSMARGVHRSVIEPPPRGGVAAALMTYMQESEQIVTVIAVGTKWREATSDEASEARLEHAGGYVVQLLPGAARGPLMIMTERLEAMPPMGDLLAQVAGSPDDLLAEILHGMPFAQLDRSGVHFGCKCSREAVVASLASIPRDELQEILDEEELLEMRCDYCGKEYKLGRQHLQGLLDPS